MTDQDTRAEDVVKRYSLYASGAGLIPVPLVDWAAVSALQYKMVKEIADAYSVSFDGNRVVSLVGSLLGGFATTGLGYGVGHQVLKAIPIVGPILGAWSVPAVAGAVTWAVGRVFVMHFAAGGTFFDFDPERMRSQVESLASERLK